MTAMTAPANTFAVPHVRCYCRLYTALFDALCPVLAVLGLASLAGIGYAWTHGYSPVPPILAVLVAGILIARRQLIALARNLRDTLKLLGALALGIMFLIGAPVAFAAIAGGWITASSPAPWLLLALIVLATAFWVIWNKRATLAGWFREPVPA